MAFARMLAVAWIASLYAALLLVLLVFFLNPALPIRLGTLLGLLPLAWLISLPLAVGWPAGYRFLRIFARRRLRVRWLSFKHLLGFGCANLLLVTLLYAANAQMVGASIPEATETRLRVATSVIALVTGAALVAATIRRARKAKATQRACFVAAVLLPVLLLLLRGGPAQAKPSPYTPELLPLRRRRPGCSSSESREPRWIRSCRSSRRASCPGLESSCSAARTGGWLPFDPACRRWPGRACSPASSRPSTESSGMSATI
jgi:hypothetical protein